MRDPSADPPSNGRGVRAMAALDRPREQPTSVRPVLGALLVKFDPTTPGGRWRLWAAFEIGVAVLVLTGIAWLLLLGHEIRREGRQLRADIINWRTTDGR